MKNSKFKIQNSKLIRSKHKETISNTQKKAILQPRNSFRYYIGNILMFSALAILFFVYYPFIRLYLDPPKISENLPSKGYFIQIPKIGAQAPIILNVDPWNSKDYLQKLTQGVAHAQNTALPWEKGTSFLFAHSSDVPWRISRYNTVFFRLGELKKGDEIFIIKNGEKLKYKVVDKKEVWPSEVEYLTETSKDQLILQTCTPIGTDLKRLLIFAVSNN